MRLTKLLTAIRNARSPSPSLKLSPVLISPRQESEQRSLSLEEIVRRGQQAQELLNNSLFNESFSALKHDLISQISVASLADVNGHTRLVLAFQTANAVEKHLRNLIHDGEAATQALNLRGKRID